jgi:hypothetical protein
MSIVWKVSVYVKFISFTLQSIHGNSSLSSFSEINKTEDNRVTTRLPIESSKKNE